MASALDKQAAERPALDVPALEVPALEVPALERLDDNFVRNAAPNADAEKNGRLLVAKGKFSELHRDADTTLIFGNCAGSGKEPYRVSCDFARAGEPTYRCSCPSRQFPCKHCVGLMVAWVSKRASFTVGEVPSDLAEKRGKLAAKTEKKAEASDKPRQVNKSALAKKIKEQLAGIDLLERLTLDLVKLGIGNTNAKTAREIEERAKQLGNAYLPGAQAALHRYTQLFSDEAGAFDAKMTAAAREATFGEALDQLTRLNALVKQGRAYLQARLEDPDLKPETTSPIAAWLGHAWQMGELKAAGLIEANAELVQLAFYTADDPARKEFIDIGTWMLLSTGRVVTTQNYRPYKAVKYIKSDDSFFDVAQVPELAVYPGEVNPRVRWEAMTPRPATAIDWQRVREHARGDFAAVVKEVKNSLKAPLAEKQPVYALAFERIGLVGDAFVVEDAKGERLVLTDRGGMNEPASVHLLKLLPSELFAAQVLVGRFYHDVDHRTLEIKPLSIVTKEQLVRLTF